MQMGAAKHVLQFCESGGDFVLFAFGDAFGPALPTDAVLNEKIHDAARGKDFAGRVNQVLPNSPALVPSHTFTFSFCARRLMFFTAFAICAGVKPYSVHA